MSSGRCLWLSQGHSLIPELDTSMAFSLIRNNDWDSQSSQFQGNVGDSGATVGQMCSKTVKGKTSKAMGAKGKVGMVVLSKVKTKDAFYGRGVSIRWRFYASGQETSASRTRRAPSCTGRPLGSGRKIGREQEGRKQVLYLLATQWIPFWGSDGIPSMGIFTTEGGRNWGWRKTVGKQINTKTAT